MHSAPTSPLNESLFTQTTTKLMTCISMLCCVLKRIRRNFISFRQIQMLFINCHFCRDDDSLLARNEFGKTAGSRRQLVSNWVQEMVIVETNFVKMISHVKKTRSLHYFSKVWGFNISSLVVLLPLYLSCQQVWNKQTHFQGGAGTGQTLDLIYNCVSAPIWSVGCNEAHWFTME